MALETSLSRETRVTLVGESNQNYYNLSITATLKKLLGYPQNNCVWNRKILTQLVTNPTPT